MKKILQSVGKVKEKDFHGSMVASGGQEAVAEAEASTSTTQEHYETPSDVYHGLTDAFKEVLGSVQSSQCKLPRTYGYGYEKLPDFVEKDPGPLKPEEIDNTDWSDGSATATASADGLSKDKYKPVPVVHAGRGCNFYILPDEKICQCPYDKFHRILEMRFPQHLVKCRENYIKQRAKAGKEIEIIICKFDFEHHILRSCETEHLKVCPKALEAAQNDRKFDKLFEKSSGAEGNGKADTDGRKVFDDSENWEKDRPVPAYDPAVKLNQSASLFYKPQGLTKSERKKYRQDTAARHAKEDELKKAAAQQHNVDFTECFPKCDESRGYFDEIGCAEQEEDDDDDDDGNVEK